MQKPVRCWNLHNDRNCLTLHWHQIMMMSVQGAYRWVKWMKMVVQIEECVHENRDATLCDLGNARVFWYHLSTWQFAAKFMAYLTAKQTRTMLVWCRPTGTTAERSTFAFKRPCRTYHIYSERSPDINSIWKFYLNRLNFWWIRLADIHTKCDILVLSLEACTLNMCVRACILVCVCALTKSKCWER